MKSTKWGRRIVPIVLTGLATIPAGLALNSPAALAASSKTAKTVTYKGPIVDSFYGPVQVSIEVKSKKIVKVKIGAAPDTSRSMFIQSQALPMLRQETLQAQSARIDAISGATQTSGAYIQSLQSAVKKAKKAKALK